ncbi:uncharacterized protein BDZ99DRAFT_463362 [Mytilinidion resinicola]|uniref:Uncharacterized protein n=1 Tax=Mytilinidion resinicola TaxID=574789 RepID=A0A6A6YNI4_9PEZI|nr:uncharacterized protein BDZ99DRAFT_463362 [Mytilinidion resinicola]KAF2809574.1 hypothetical protein BDZ99DRAFT_463362 [Mytilinidion resinicola]
MPCTHTSRALIHTSYPTEHVQIRTTRSPPHLFSRPCRTTQKPLSLSLNRGIQADSRSCPYPAAPAHRPHGGFLPPPNSASLTSSSHGSEPRTRPKPIRTAASIPHHPSNRSRNTTSTNAAYVFPMASPPAPSQTPGKGSGVLATHRIANWRVFWPTQRETPDE